MCLGGLRQKRASQLTRPSITLVNLRFALFLSFRPASSGRLYKVSHSLFAAMALPAAGLGLAARAAVGLGTLAYNAYRRTNSSVASTPMAAPASAMPVARRVGGRRVPYRRRRVPRPVFSFMPTYRRVSAQQSFILVAGAYKNTQDVSMSQIFTDDIRNAYDMYRLTKVTVEIIPTHDPGGQGGAGGPTTTNYSVWTANDTQGTFSTGSWANPRELAQFENYKYATIVSGSRFLYTFYPKVSNLVAGDSGIAAAGNYTVNPWLSFSNLTVPHHRLLYEVRSSSNVSTETFVVTYTLHFQCRRAR